MTDYLTPLYTDVRAWLLSMFPNAPIVRGYQNLEPIPENGIIMTFLMEKRLDQLSRTYEDDNTNLIVFDSIQGTMQVDCYGENSHAMARQISSMWQTPITTEILQNCQPLYCGDPKDLTFVNETGQYELRFMVGLELQYNTKYENAVQSAIDMSNIKTEGL